MRVDQRSTSYRKDDRRLHLDAFPSRPTQGRRILRVFSNVNLEGAPRVWQLGEPFADVAARFLPQLRRSPPGSAWLLDWSGITKGRRSVYDQLMLRLHDRIKADTDYQRNAWHCEFSFPPGSSWIIYTDTVLHAAIDGQHALEQTFYLPVTAMLDPELSPLRVLERMTGRRLTKQGGTAVTSEVGAPEPLSS